ncbi:MAG: DUF2752 domain-containing protein [Gloeomargaritaceae cyanobacterium C42_A2020_066]|nr:DUF2752 domain-containing protein [Gloeomargaritaceae cyanobacterium C42_A2020_066]
MVCTGALSRPAGWVRWQRLGVGLGSWLAVWLYSRPYQAGFRIPGLTCPLRALTGVPCPACGLTRSLMALARGRGRWLLRSMLWGRPWA